MLPLESHDLGLCDFEKVWKLQQELVEQRARQLIPDQLLLVEHPPVVTCGRSFKPEHLKCLPQQVPVYHIERGGDVSFHEPGQLVAYPIIALPPERRNLRAFIRLLEQSLICTLADLGFSARSHPAPGHTGVWLGERKIASIGIAVRRWVTWHGLALNVNNAMDLAQGLHPCGFPPHMMISLKEAGQREYNIHVVKEKFQLHFQRLLSTL